jgi:tetratricopeptide (TPR) repeat protein
VENYQAAETAFLAALTPMPDYLYVHEVLGILYFRTERYKEAHRHLAHAAGLGLHTAQLFGALGYLNSQLGNFWGAVNAYQEALMLDPDFEQCKRNLLQALNMTGQHQSALTLVESMLPEHPDEAGLWLFRASSALQAGERETALSSLETAIRLGDHRASNFQVGATLHMEAGSIERAVELLKIGFTKGMDFSLFDQGMNWLMQADEWNLLEQMLVSARGKWGDLDDLQRSKILMREADISLRKNEKSAAGDALEKAIVLDPSNAYALMSLADIYREAGKFTRAESLYQRAGVDGLYRENALVSLAQLALDQ